MALAAWKLAVEVKWAAMAGQQQAVVGKPVLIPLGVAIPGAQAVYAGTSEAKPARDPAARMAVNVAMQWMMSGLERVKATETLVEGSCRIGG
jgi:hypothetical protein